MEKAFDPKAVEAFWNAKWDELGLGIADAAGAKPSFAIAMPPPNITGRLHLGHACGSSIQDALARYNRMRGFEVEWCPGTDHAAIATNAVVERLLVSEGTSREELGREKFLARVDDWYAEYGGHILRQMRSLGFSADWSRQRFTLDEGYVRSIRTVFKQLYDEGLIYRGPRIVNWCPNDQSAISDEEVEWQEHSDTLTYLRYPVEGGESIIIATARPETMLGDTAVAVAPGDKRYAHLVGKMVTLPLVDRQIPIIEDEAVTEFGTGALKVTPGHSPADYEIGQRHALPAITVIAPDGTMDIPELPSFHGMPADQARAAITEALRQVGAVVKIEPYEHEVGHCDRCGHVIEPLISAQWWVAMKKLAEPAIEVVEQGKIQFFPANYTKHYLDWMYNIRDWCISRQIWLGHDIPVSTCGNGHTFAWIDKPTTCPQCNSSELKHDPDVLDTWFSSALWPYAIFGWPDETEDLAKFYPTDTLVTDRGIIFLWVARMIMTGLKFAGDIPFRHVVITSTIQAKDGSRMSKSKGNVIDPQEMIDRYGADAVRAWGCTVGTGGQDVRFDEERIASYQRFANKIWNSTRFIVSRIGDGDRITSVPAVEPAHLLPEDRWMLARAAAAITTVETAFEQYRFHDAMEALYETIWHSYCDWYVEMAKSRLESDDVPSRNAAIYTLVTALDALLRALHPFMPFISEECAQRLGSSDASLQWREWPRDSARWGSTPTASVDSVLDLVQAIRAARQDAGIRPSRQHPDEVVVTSGAADLTPADQARLLEALDSVHVVDAHTGSGEPLRVFGAALSATVVLARSQSADDSARLAKQLADLDRQLAHLDAQLSNAAFVSRAKPEVVSATQARRNLIAKQRNELSRLLGGEAA